MADPAFTVVLNAGEASPATITLRGRPSPLAALTFVAINLFVGEVSPTTITLWGDSPLGYAMGQLSRTLDDSTLTATGTVTAGGGTGVNPARRVSGSPPTKRSGSGA
jgi:hypothetical protein